MLQAGLGLDEKQHMGEGEAWTLGWTCTHLLELNNKLQFLKILSLCKSFIQFSRITHSGINSNFTRNKQLHVVGAQGLGIVKNSSNCVGEFLKDYSYERTKNY